MRMNGRVDLPPGLETPEALERTKKISDALIADSVMHTSQGCYPNGTAGYSSGCRHPNFEQQVAGAYSHWGYWPYDGRANRDVVVVDELGNTRAREWLQWAVNRNNNEQHAYGAHRPRLVYYTGEYLQSLGYPQFSGCQANFAQYMEFCPSGNQNNSWAAWGVNSAGHVTVADAQIGPLHGTWQTYQDIYTANIVVHEYGHLLGVYSHDTDCASVMTYCSTFNQQYLYFTYDGSGEANQRTVFNQNYDSHVN